MTKVTRKEWYSRVNATWPAGPLPKLTPGEAFRAARKLWRFETGWQRIEEMQVTSGRRRTLIRGRTLIFNPLDGWHTLVHILSHFACPGVHGADHARCELRMIKEVVRRGWLEGKLKSREKPVVEPTVDQVRAKKAARIEERLKRWETRRKRAETMIRKLKKSKRYYEKLQNTEAPALAGASSF